MSAALALLLAACGGTTASDAPTASAGAAGVGQGAMSGAGAGGAQAFGGAGAGPSGGSAGGAGSGQGGEAGAGAGGTSGAAGKAGGPPKPCSEACGMPQCQCPYAPMVPVHYEFEGKKYDWLIDATEVTNSQYSTFLQAKPDQTGVEPYCAWNDDFAPNGADFCKKLFDGVDRAQHPVVCIDWCDAQRFCQWSGKRLCQSYKGELIQTAGSPAAEWLLACAGQGGTPYPYGNTPDTQACWTKEAAAGTGKPNELQPVKTKATCEGSAAGAFDLAGNAREWTGACNSYIGAADLCNTAASSFAGTAAEGTCTDSSVPPRSRNNDPIVGFRCCADGP